MPPLVTPKSPNLRETNTSDARYTDLNRANRGLGLSMMEFDNMFSGVQHLPNNELRMPVSYIENAADAVQPGDRVLIANRVARIRAVDTDGADPDIMLHLQIVEENMPLPPGAVEAEENFINAVTREVDHIIGIADADSAISSRLRGGSTDGLNPAAPVIISKNSADPATWGATARAQRKYAGFVKVAVTIEAYSDAGSTPVANGQDIYASVAGEPYVQANAVNGQIAGGAGQVTLQLERGVRYVFRDDGELLAEVQPHPASGSAYLVPLDGDIPSPAVVIHNATAGA